MQLGDGSIMIIQSIYYYFDHHWRPLHVFGICMYILVLIGTLTLPESPKYLYARSHFKQSRQSLKVVAKFNRAKVTSQQIDDLIFDTEKIKMQQTKG